MTTNQMVCHAYTVLFALMVGGTTAHAVDYPQWRGADGSGAAPDVGVECIEDMSQAKLVWKSEEIPNVYNFQMNAAEAEGGYTSPSYADGRIYMQWYQPAGDAIDLNRKKNFPSYPPELWKVYADDVFICFDATTGKTLWKRVFEKKGAYLWGLTGLMHTQPAIHDGKVYGVGSLGRVYCLDAKTGDVVWETTLGEAHDWAVAQIDEWLKVQADSSYTFDQKNKWIRNNRAVNVFGVGADGSLFSVLMPQVSVGTDGGGPATSEASVLVCNDGCVAGGKRGGSAALVGIDLKTGKELWRRADAIGNRQSPTAWRNDGKAFILHNDKGSNFICTDALTGKVAWTVKDAPCTMDAGPVVSGSHIVVHGGKGGITCLEADAKGAKVRWQVDPNDFPLRGDRRGWTQPVIYRGHLYCSSTPGPRQSTYACIDMADGKVKAVLDGRGGAAYSAILAADGRLVMDWEVLDADPGNFRLLMKTGGFKPGQDWKSLHGDALSVLSEQGGQITKADGSVVKCDLPNARMFQTNLLIGGFYYYRGPHNLFCFDLRKPEHRK